MEGTDRGDCMTKIYYDDKISSIVGCDVLIFLEGHNKAVIELARDCIKRNLGVKTCLGTQIIPDKEYLDTQHSYVVLENGIAKFKDKRRYN